MFQTESELDTDFFQMLEDYEDEIKTEFNGVDKIVAACQELNERKPIFLGHYHSLFDTANIAHLSK